MMPVNILNWKCWTITSDSLCWGKLPYRVPFKKGKVNGHLI